VPTTQLLACKQTGALEHASNQISAQLLASRQISLFPEFLPKEVSAQLLASRQMIAQLLASRQLSSQQTGALEHASKEISTQFLAPGQIRSGAYFNGFW
jgi:hypothetical protein